MDPYEKLGENLQTATKSVSNISSYSLRDSFNSIESGYFSFTPHSHSYNLHRSKLSFLSGRRLHRTRSKPYATKFNHKFKCSEINSYDSFIEDSLGNISKNPAIDCSSIQSSLDSTDAERHTSSFKMELRSHKKKQCQLSSYQVALTASPFAYEPINTDVEMKLVIPQSTPCIISSPILPIPLHNISFSPIGYQTSPCIGSVNDEEFRNLSITEHRYISKKNKPKKLDFSKHAIFASFRRQRATPDYTGKETVDIFKLLGEKSNHPRIVSKILDYLSPQDLCSVNMVSKSWQKICSNDIKAQERRLKHLTLRQCSKENIVSINKSKLEDVQMSPKTRFPRRGFLTVVSSNLLQVPKMHLQPSSPPVSPSKVIFHSFIKAGRSLAPRDQLVPCPQCKFACRIEHDKNVGTCSRQGCPMEEFCLLCSSKIHVGEPCKMPLLATPTKRGKHQQPVVGTKQCKRNLRRISRLI